MKDTLIVKIKLLPGGKMPVKKTAGAAAFDCYARIKNVTGTDYGYIGEHPIPVPLGFALELPKGYHAEIYPRSSIGLNTKLRMANSVGIIDSDYRGEVCAILESISPGIIGGITPMKIENGQRIAQMIIKKDEEVEFVPVEELSETERGEGGFGSTGAR